MYNSAFKRNPKKMQKTIEKHLLDQINLLIQPEKRLTAEDVKVPIAGKDNKALDAYDTGDVSKPKAGSKVNVDGVEYTVQTDGSLKPSD